MHQSPLVESFAIVFVIKRLILLTSLLRLTLLALLFALQRVDHSLGRYDG